MVGYVLIVATMLFSVMGHGIPPEVEVKAVIPINIDLKEISHDRAANITAANKGRQFNFIKSLVTINNTVYLETIQQRMFEARYISPDHYSTIQSLQTFNSWSANQSREDRMNGIRGLIVPLVRQAFLSSHAQYSKIKSDDVATSFWFVKLLPSTKSDNEQVSTELPVTTFNVTIRYLLSYDDGKCLIA